MAWYLSMVLAIIVPRYLICITLMRIRVDWFYFILICLLIMIPNPNMLLRIIGWNTSSTIDYTRCIIFVYLVVECGPIVIRFHEMIEYPIINNNLYRNLYRIQTGENIWIPILHTALFCPKWRHVEMFCTFFKDLKALLQISLTKHNYLSHLLPFWMQYIPKNPFFMMLELGFLK